MSSSRLARLRNQAGAGTPQPQPQTQQRQSRQQQRQQPSGNVNPMQVLQWHETRLKD